MNKKRYVFHAYLSIFSILLHIARIPITHTYSSWQCLVWE